MNFEQKNFAQEKMESSTELLRSATEQDLAEILALERLPEFHTMVGKWSAEEHLRAMHDPDIRYFMVGPANGDAAGFAILRGILSPHRNVELKRFVIGSPDRGLGQRALHAILTHVFQQLGAHRLWLDVFSTNSRALHIYRKAGFQQEGILREAVYRDGAFHDLLLLSILDREFQRSEE